MIVLPRGQNASSHYFDVPYKKEAIKIEKLKIILIHILKAHRMLENFTGGGIPKNEKMGIEFSMPNENFEHTQ